MFLSDSVSILVLLDSGRGVRKNANRVCRLLVSILVLLDSGRGDGIDNYTVYDPTRFQSLFYWILGAESMALLWNPCLYCVSILVLLDSGRGEWVNTQKRFDRLCFNPCFIGFWARSRCERKGVVDFLWFQSLFYWILGAEIYWTLSSTLVNLVSILVLLDSGRGVYLSFLFSLFLNVSILVLLDSGRGGKAKANKQHTRAVSILVLLDSGRGEDTTTSKTTKKGGFNPCFIGFWARSQRTLQIKQNKD